MTCDRADFGCATGGYGAQQLGWPDTYYGWANGWAGFDGHNCTRYAAFKLKANGLPNPGRSFGNAKDWDNNVAAIYGAGKVNGTPAERMRTFFSRTRRPSADRTASLRAPLTLALASTLLAVTAVNAQAVGRSYYYVFTSEGLTGGRNGDCFQGDASIVQITGNHIYEMSFGGCDIFYDQGLIAGGVIRWQGKCHDFNTGGVSRYPGKSGYSGSSPRRITEIFSLTGYDWRVHPIVGPATSLASANRWYARVSGSSRGDTAATWLRRGRAAHWTSPQC